MIQESPEISHVTPGQQRFILRWAALPFLSIAGTAKSVGVSKDSAYTWRRDPAFVEACDTARRATQDDLAQEAFDALRGQLPTVMKAKIDLALNARDERARDAAQTWLLEQVFGKARDRVTLRADVAAQTSGPTKVADVSNDELVSLARTIFEHTGHSPSASSS